MKKINYLVAMISTMVLSHAYAAQLIELSDYNVQSLSGKTLIKNLKQDLPALLGSGVDDQLKERSQLFEANVNHTRYYQMYRGIQVWPQEIAVSVKNGKLNTMYGTLVRGLDSDITSIEPQINAKQALELGVNFFRNSDKNKNLIKADWTVENSKSDLRIYVNPETQRGHLVYVVSFFADVAKGGQPHRPFQVIDAQTGELIKSTDRLTTADGKGYGGNLKTGKYFYGKEFPAFQVTKSGTSCTMKTTDTTTIDLKNSTSSTTPFAFKCTENKEKVINGAYGPLNDAHFFAGVIVGLYKDWYNTAPLKIPIEMRVHYSTNYENAFWNGSSMNFGDGKNTFYPLVSLDVSSHEIAHGFTEFNSNLDYEKQSVGMNEAFSDMAGEAAEFYAKGKNDFAVGAEIFKTKGQALRYMDDPKKDNTSIDNAKDYIDCDTYDFICRDKMDVHYTSGVYNKAFYSLATTKGWTTRKAFDVFVKANQNYWTPTSTFASGAQGVRDAAKDLGYPTADVVAAFAKVGITVK